MSQATWYSLQSIRFLLDGQNQDLLIADLWEWGTEGILEEAGSLRAFFPDSTDLEEIAGRHKSQVADINRNETFDFDAFERENWDPILAGNRFFIAPSWIQTATPPGRIRLTLDATTAFGTGRHESTQLSIEALENCVQRNSVVFDIGCGSGILSISASLLGAGFVAGCDLDGEAIQTARQHTPLPLFVGTADCLKDAAADVVVANISAATADRLAPELNRIAKPDGVLILAGFISNNPPKRFIPYEVREKNGWQCWLCHPQPLEPANQPELYQRLDPWW